MRDVRRYLATAYFKGNKSVSWRKLSKDILPGYEPGRLDVPAEFRDALNTELTLLENEGYVTLRRYKKETAFSLYSVSFTDKMERLCRYYGLTTTHTIAQRIIEALDDIDPVSSALDSWVRRQVERARQGRPDKAFWHNVSSDEMRKIVLMTDAVMQNKDTVYIKNMAKRVLGDSKGFSAAVRNKTCRLLEECSGKDILDGLAQKRELLGKRASILQLYGVIEAPQYIPVYGDIEVSCPTGTILSSAMPYVFVSDSIEQYRRIRIRTPAFITIENKTTFNDFEEEGYTKFFVSGYPGYAERELLSKIYTDNPGVRFYHWGDIDCGGFGIYADIKKYIPTILPFNMDIDTLVKYKEFTSPLTEKDRDRLRKVYTGPFRQVASYMLKHNVKLEQESIYA